MQCGGVAPAARSPPGTPRRLDAQGCPGLEPSRQWSQTPSPRGLASCPGWQRKGHVAAACGGLWAAQSPHTQATSRPRPGRGCRPDGSAGGAGGPGRSHPCPGVRARAALCRPPWWPRRPRRAAGGGTCEPWRASTWPGVAVPGLHVPYPLPTLSQAPRPPPPASLVSRFSSPTASAHVPGEIKTLFFFFVGGRGGRPARSPLLAGPPPSPERPSRCQASPLSGHAGMTPLPRLHQPRSPSGSPDPMGKLRKAGRRAQGRAQRSHRAPTAPAPRRI